MLIGLQKKLTGVHFRRHDENLVHTRHSEEQARRDFARRKPANATRTTYCREGFGFGIASRISAAVVRPPCSLTILLKKMTPCLSIRKVDG